MIPAEHHESSDNKYLIALNETLNSIKCLIDKINKFDGSCSISCKIYIACTVNSKCLCVIIRKVSGEPIMCSHKCLCMLSRCQNRSKEQKESGYKIQSKKAKLKENKLDNEIFKYITKNIKKNS